MKTCTQCGANIPDNAQFCAECGAHNDASTQKNTCPQCGKETAQGAKFCLDCGYNLQTTNTNGQQPPVTKKSRTGMLVLGCILGCAGLIDVVGLLIGRIPVRNVGDITSAVWVFILSAMFFILAFSPKNIRYIFGRSSGISKKAFVLLCVFVPIVIGAILAIILK